jgi:hypothetical protein
MDVEITNLDHIISNAQLLLKIFGNTRLDNLILLNAFARAKAVQLLFLFFFVSLMEQYPEGLWLLSDVLSNERLRSKLLV